MQLFQFRNRCRRRGFGADQPAARQNRLRPVDGHGTAKQPALITVNSSSTRLLTVEVTDQSKELRSRRPARNLDLPVILITPHEFRRHKRSQLVGVQNVVGHTNSLLRRVRPVLHADVFSVPRMMPTSDVTHSENLAVVDRTTELVAYDTVGDEQP